MTPNVGFIMKLVNRSIGFFLFLVLAPGLAACRIDTDRSAASGISAGPGYESPLVYRGDDTVSFDEMISAASGARAVLVGETHDRFDHHLNQLEIIKKLHRLRPGLAIGMEQFQQPFQAHLDDYINSVIDTEEMLIATEYYKRWQLDFRFYEPILSYAREHGIPVIALNVPVELTRKVAAAGLDALDEEERARVPRLDRSDGGYEERLKLVYEEHPDTMSGASFENFYIAQLLWDESMAETAAEYLRSNPEDAMVVLAGQGHIEFGSGIPNRLARRIHGKTISIAHGTEQDARDKLADFVLDSQPVELPKRGFLGVIVDPESEEALISDLTESGAAREAGLRVGDIVIAIDGRPVAGLPELKSRLWRKRPGDTVSVTVRREVNETVHYQLNLR